MIEVIDSDTHVDETDATWEYVLPEEAAFKPTTGYPRNPDPSRPPSRYWIVDGHRKPRRIRDDAKSLTTVEARELLDVDVRLRHMDELGIGVQVIYPSLMLVEPAEHAEVELAMARSYNRWLADRCAKSGGRLRWVCIAPMRNMTAALDLLRFAKDHGACGVLKKGDLEAGKYPADPYFFPLYQEAERLDLPICMHLGSGVPNHTPIADFSLGAFMNTTLPVIHGVHSLIAHEVPKKFPKLRFGAIEAGASWVPFVAYDLERAEKTRHRKNDPALGYAVGENVYRENNVYVTAQVDENFDMILPSIGPDNLLVGSDYTHQDSSQELTFARTLEERAAAGEISRELVRKMVYDNPKKFYGL
jgi:hypothetical protein